MCRHLAYLGPPVALDELLLEPQHSLREQTWAPADMRSGGTINVDGFGAGWYPADSQLPTRYRSVSPMFSDANFAALAPHVTSTAVLAAVRSASAGTPVVEGACAPFGDGKWMFSHNGRVSGWPDSLADVAAKLDPADLMALDAPVDSAVVWALLRHRLHSGQPAVEAVCDTLREVVEAAPESRMNLLLTDGTVVIATTWTHALSVRHEHGAVTVSSEPFGAGVHAGQSTWWQAVPDRHLVVAAPHEITVTALPESR